MSQWSKSETSDFDGEGGVRGFGLPANTGSQYPLILSFSPWGEGTLLVARRLRPAGFLRKSAEADDNESRY